MQNAVTVRVAERLAVLFALRYPMELHQVQPHPEGERCRDTATAPRYPYYRRFSKLCPVLHALETGDALPELAADQPLLHFRQREVEALTPLLDGASETNARQQDGEDENDDRAP